MPSTPNVNFNVINLATQASKALAGIYYMEGITKRGPISDPKDLITSYSQFEKIFGGFLDNSDFPLIAKRALDLGAVLRINSVRHYTDITNASTLSAVKANNLAVRVLTFSAASVASNSLAATVNGTAITPVVFATNSNTTLAAYASAIAGVTAYVAQVVVVNAGVGTDDDRVLLVYPKVGITLNITGTTITGGASQPTITGSDRLTIIDASNNQLFDINPKYAGADYNNLSVTISNASNGNANYFKVTIAHSLESSLNEEYDNILIPNPGPNVGASKYLLPITNGSNWADVTYFDLSAYVGQARPVNGTYYFGGGSNGGTVVATDYAGDAAGGTGFYAFDNFDDGYYIAAPELSTDTIHQAGAAYVIARKDLMYFAHLDNTLTTASTINAAKDALAIDSPLVVFTAGGIKVTHPVSGEIKSISEIGDIFGLATNVHTKLGTYRSFAGSQNGVILNSLGPVNNFGSQGKFADLNLINNHQINMVINKDNKVYLGSGFTGTQAYSPESFIAVETLILYLKKTLRPSLSKYLEEPSDIPTFKRIYYEVKPFLDQLVSDGALVDYKWDGDQDVASIDDAIVNTPADLQLGKYKINFFIKPIAPLQEIKVNIIISAAGVSFDESASLL